MYIVFLSSWTNDNLAFVLFLKAAVTRQTEVRFREYLLYCRGLSSFDCTLYCSVPNVIMAQFIYEKVLEWNVNKSATRLYINAPKVE
jgi:hypothetical protein